MNRHILLILVIGAGLLGLAACASVPPAPELVQGDAWEYGLTAADLPAGWSVSEQSAQTAVDLARPPDPAVTGITATLPISVPASLQNVQQIYAARYAPPEASTYADFTLEVLIFPTLADAQAGLSAEAPGEGWELVAAPAVGEQSQVWRYQAPLTETTQGLYRVDFRYWNAVASLTMLGGADVLPGPEEPLRYAQIVLGKFTAGADPAALRELRAAGLPDVRGRLLSQTQLAELDPVLGGRWIISDQYLGTWTLNEDFNAEAQVTLKRLGRVAGYQLYLVKPINSDEFAQVAGSALFQQVSAYQAADKAATGLKAMVGLPGALESPVPPEVGEAARAWSQVLKSADGSQIAVTEISFHVGQYVATVQLQSPPLAEGDNQKVRLNDNLVLATELAKTLAANLAR
ncbi:MAG: hypothetical protein JNK29_15170 [Anaerolineales bacterium]|nr:hypothetical protein [Anaerolineales bacterium]